MELFLHGDSATHMCAQIYKGAENRAPTQERECENNEPGESQPAAWMHHPDAEKGESMQLEHRAHCAGGSLSLITAALQLSQSERDLSEKVYKIWTAWKPWCPKQGWLLQR